jgi:hypothetical protein
MSESSCHKTRKLVSKYRDRIIQRALDEKKAYLLNEVEQAKEKIISDFLKTNSPRLYLSAMELVQGKPLLMRIGYSWRILCGKKK